MIRFITTATFLLALALCGDARACSGSSDDTVEGSAANAVAYAETAVRWHQIRKVSAAADDDALVHGKHAEANGLLDAAHNALDRGDYERALKHAYRVPEILHYQ